MSKSKSKPESTKTVEEINAEAMREVANVSGQRRHMQTMVLDLSQIDANPQYNYREVNYTKDSAALKGLMTAIKAAGTIINPLTIAKNYDTSPGAKPFVLLAGFRRYYSLAYLEEQTGDEAWVKNVPCVLDGNEDVTSRALTQLMENLARTDTDAMETARGLDYAIKESKRSIEEVAAITGRDKSSIRSYLQLLEMPDKVQAWIEAGPENGGLSFSAARLLNSGRIPKDRVEQLASLACGMTYGEFEKKINELFPPASAASSETGEEEGDGSGVGADGPQRAQNVVRTKQIETQVLPWLEEAKKDVAEVDAAQAQRIADYEIALQFVMNPTDDNPLAKILAPYKARHEEEKARAAEQEEADRKYKAFIKKCIKIVRDKINVPLQEGETKPTAAEGLADVRASIMKHIAEDSLEIPLPSIEGKSGDEAVTAAVDHLLGEVEQAYQKDKQERIAAAQKRKAQREAEDAAKAGEGGQALADTSGQAPAEATA